MAPVFQCYGSHFQFTGALAPVLPCFCIHCCGDTYRRLKIPHSAKVECGFWTTPEECLYDSGLIGHQYRAS